MDHLVNYLNWFLSVPYQVEGKFQAAWNQFSAAISINSGRWDANKLVYNTGLVVFVFFHNLNVWNDMLLCLDIFCKGNVVELLRVLSLKFLGSRLRSSTLSLDWICFSVVLLLTPSLPSFNPLISEGDSNLISPYSVTAESLTKVVRIEEMITMHKLKKLLTVQQILLVSAIGNV